MHLYPLRFEPVFQTYLWGGRKLATELNKPIGDEPTYAESWEMVDHDDAQSIVCDGPLKGSSLHEIVDRYSTELLGGDIAAAIRSANRPANLQNRFPLLFKFLDANKNLSVQVHPDDEMGSRLSPPDLGKTEAWYVMHAEPGSRIYAGLKPGVGEEELRQMIAESKAEEVLHSFEPQQGDCVFIPAGTVHALGAGLLIAEIQQCSNTTFRLYDWGRVDANGVSRPLHVEQGIQATDFQRGPVDPAPRTRVDEERELIVDCDKFRMETLSFNGAKTWTQRGRFSFLVVLSGAVAVGGDPTDHQLTKGETILIPACWDQVDLTCSEPSSLLVITT